MSSKKKIGCPKSKKRVNIQVEEKRDEPSSHSHNQEDEPSHQQDEVEQGNIVQQPFSSGRVARRSARKVGLPPLDPLPTVKPFLETYVRKKKRPFSFSQKARYP